MLQDLRKIWAIFTPAERRKAVWMLALMVLVAAAETGGVVSIVPFLSVLSRPGIIQENVCLRQAFERFGSGDVRQFIAALGLASIVLVVGSSLFKTVAQHALNRFIHFERHSISTRLLSRYLGQPYEFFLARNTAELSKNVLSEADMLLFSLLHPLSQMLAYGVVVLAIMAMIFWYDPRMAVCIVAGVGLLYTAIYRLVRNRLARIGVAHQTANGERHKACDEALGGIKDVKITQSADAYVSQFDHSSRQLSRHLATNDTLAQSPLYLVEAAGYSGLIVVAIVLLHQTSDVAQVLPALGLYGFAAYRLLPAAQIMYRGFARLKFSSAALDTIHRDLSLPEERLPAPGNRVVPETEIRLEAIRYAYPATPDTPVFKDFTLVVAARTSLGIVGKSGAGKSTLMDLLLGLLHPQEGFLSVDGTHIDARNVGAWQRTIGYVPQHIYLADASVAENIAFGVAPEQIDLHAVERAARAAQIHDFVSSELPDGYYTVVGERGIRLSGGQRQRIGIARALYRDPPVLFFDEATSALDAQTEGALNEAIRGLSGQKTIVVIAHKESSLRDCHRVISLADATT